MLKALRKFWNSMDQVPDCPTCKGTGEPQGPRSDVTYWKGKLVRVCWQCYGSGKV